MVTQPPPKTSKSRTSPPGIPTSSRTAKLSPCWKPLPNKPCTGHPLAPLMGSSARNCVRRCWLHNPTQISPTYAVTTRSCRVLTSSPSIPRGDLPSGVRWLESREVENLPRLLDAKAEKRSLRHTQTKPLFFIQYGTGCPVMDIVHIKASEAWGADGVLHFDPSWNAQQEGLLEGLLSHEHDGTILTFENLKLIRQYLDQNTLWDVRGHRGLNTAETQVLGHAAGADLFKINIPYGSTGGGTDPARLAVDGIYSLHLAAQYGIPFDIPGNDELSGVPPSQNFCRHAHYDGHRPQARRASHPQTAHVLFPLYGHARRHG